MEPNETLEPQELGSEAPTEAPPQFELTEDGNQVKVGGKTYLIDAAVRQEREQNRVLKQQLAALEPLLPEFQEFVENKRNGRNATVARTAEPDSEYTDDELKGVAIAYGMYTDAGELDLARARQSLDVTGRVAEARARRIVEPVARQTALTQAQRNREAARSRTFDDGRPVADARYLDQAFDALPPDLAADPQVGNLVQVLAAGLEYLDARKAGKIGSSREPQFSEGSRGTLASTPQALSGFSRIAAQARGKTPEQWSKLVNSQSTGRAERDGSYVLEDGL